MKLFSDLACFELEVHSFVEQTGLSASANPENGHGASQNHPFGRVWKIGQPTSVRQRLSSSVSVGPTRKYSRSGPHKEVLPERAIDGQGVLGDVGT